MRVPEQQRMSNMWRWTAALAGLAVLSIALVMAVVVTPASRVEALGYTVNSTADPGDGTCNAAECTLREAITTAEGTAASDTIGFNIPSSDAGCIGGVCTIALGANLPDIANPLGGTLGITGPSSHSVVVEGAPGDCFHVTSNGNTIRNLVINNCGDDGIELDTANSNTIAGNYIGTNAAGTVPVANTGNGVSITGTSTGNTVGGAAAADRNLISGNSAAGVSIGDTARTTTIRGNYIGTDVTGSAAALGNGADGIVAGGNGANAITGNVIGRNTGNGITLSSGNNSVQGNSIGLGANGLAILGNTVDGVQITAGNNTVGGTASGNGNVIAHNGAIGVDVTGGTAGIRRNSMFLNTGLGISNFAPPVIIVGTFSAGIFTVGGTAPALSVVEVFLADPDREEGQTYVATYPVDGAGQWGGPLCVNGPVAIVATATDTTVNDTSDFSAPMDLASGTCSGAATATPTATGTPPTSTPTNTPTSTGTPLTATPTRTSTPIGGATVTPTTGPRESVPLVAGCNPVASTYPDGTPITTIAAGVSPSTILISIWWYNTGTGAWLGYSPQFPDQSNLSSVDRLEAIFICVSSAGTWSRPLI